MTSGDSTSLLKSDRFDFSEDSCSVLGEGTFGCVLKGHDKEAGEPVAIKKTAFDNVDDKELNLLVPIQSEYVVRYIGWFYKDEDPDLAYIVMELCDEDLQTHLERHGKLTPYNVDTVSDSLAFGYRIIHELGIIHRDIKPENMLLRYAPESLRIIAAKMTDFETCRITKKKSGGLAGTPLYMAPEVGANLLSLSEYNAEIDMWSIGVVLYQCLTGNVPFGENDLCKLFLSACNSSYGGYQPPALPEDTLPFYVSLLDRLLQADPKKRMTPDEYYDYVKSREEFKVNETTLLHQPASPGLFDMLQREFAVAIDASPNNDGCVWDLRLPPSKSQGELGGREHSKLKRSTSDAAGTTIRRAWSQCKRFGTSVKRKVSTKRTA